MKQTFRQSMAWLHTWAGLSVVWVLFFMFTMGTISYFEAELDRWMEPERPLSYEGIDTASMLDEAATRLASKTESINDWYVFLPVGRESSFEIKWEEAADNKFGHIDKEELLGVTQTENGPVTSWVQPRGTDGGHALYIMHYALHYLPRSLTVWLVALCSMFMFVSIITGVVIHKKIFKDFFTFRPKKGQRTWLDMHNILAVMALPFHLMITYSGLLFYMLTIFPVVAVATYGTNATAIRDAVNEVFPRQIVEREPVGTPAPLVSLKPMYEEVEARWGKNAARYVNIKNPGDQNATVMFRRVNDQLVRDNLQQDRLTFDGVTGELLTKEPPTGFSGLVTANRTILSLHMGIFAGPVVRWLYFLTGLVGTAMIATGMLLWTAKRRQKQERSPEGVKRSLVIIEKLNTGTIIGLPIGIGAYFWANRLLPLDLADRAALEQDILFITWAATLVYAVSRPVLTAWKDLLWFGAGLYALTPVLNYLTSDYHLGVTVPAGIWSIAGVDLTLLAFAALMAVAARKVGNRQQKINNMKASKQQVQPAPKFLEAAE